MEFETLTVSLFGPGPNSETIAGKEAEDLQDAHLDFLASLHVAGSLQAAGPFLSPPGRMVRGMTLHRLPPDEVRALLANDPAVRAGKLTFQVFTWKVPKGAIVFAPTRFPRAQSET
ncbi:MAG: YciI family protein [Thermoplasmata archaeon]